MRPVRPLVPVASCLAVLGGWGLVAHNSGAGWVQGVGDVLAGVLAVGLLGPAVAAARGRVRLRAAPADATAGVPVDLVVDAGTRLRVRPLVPEGPESFVGPGYVRRGGSGSGDARPGGSGFGGRGSGRSGFGGSGVVTLVPERRGVHDVVVLDVASAAPFGLLWWHRQVVLPLPQALHVRPRVGEPLPAAVEPKRSGGEGGRPSPQPVGEPRGVRPYRPGDLRRRVHWPATAHSGDLMVRDMEGPASGPVSLVVRLPADPDAGEHAAERALGTVLSHVERGTPVVLTTTEADGRAVGTVTDRRNAGRRLARAVAEPDPGRARTGEGRRTASG